MKSELKNRVFIGGANEETSLKVLDFLCRELPKRGNFSMRPWNRIFESGGNFLEKLLDESLAVDAAILIFGKSDERRKRDGKDELKEKQFIPRDNVVLEFGLFVKALGLDRVHVLCEEGINIPTDLTGRKWDKFDDVELEAHLRKAVERISSRWETLNPLRPERDIWVGVLKTLAEIRAETRSTEKEFSKWEMHGEGMSKPIFIDSASACRHAYVEGLSLAGKRFWTTTYLTSQFWTGHDPEIFGANKKLLERFKDIPDSSRRLVLLGRDYEAEKIEYIKTLRFHRQQKNETAGRDIRNKFRNLSHNFSRLSKLGCDVRVVHEAGESKELPAILSFDSKDSELAIYDDFRVDVFGGGGGGGIAEVKVFSPAYRDFEGVLESCDLYFRNLWRESKPASEFLEELEWALEVASSKIDYTSNWLARFEFGLSQEDQDLKAVEILQVEECLKERERWGKISRYLDIGTCTGRYPLGLQSGVSSDGYILGVDDDDDCLDFCRNKMSSLPKGANVVFENADFLSNSTNLGGKGNFDLITCMLGTFSHFCWDWKSNKRSKNSLDFALERIYRLLAPDGLFFVGMWSEEACRQRHLLGIYDSHDVDRLVDWTPNETVFQDFLRKNKFVSERIQLEKRLTLYVCQKRSRRPHKRRHQRSLR